MLRFIDLTKCDPEEFDDNDFAFFSTVDNSFINMAGEYTWNSSKEFSEWYAYCVEHGHIDEMFTRVMPLERFLSLIPEGR